MMDRDMRPTRFDLTLQYAREFILEWFDQNPLGQIGIVGMRAGLGERIGDLSGEHKPWTTARAPLTLYYIKVIRKKSWVTLKNDISSSLLENQVYKMLSRWREQV